MLVIFIIVFCILLICSGILVASEFALTSLETSEIPDSNSQKKIITNAQSNLSFTLSSIQLGITLVTLMTGFISTYIFEEPIKKIISKYTNNILSSNATEVLITIIVAIIATSFSMIFGELVPKNFAMNKPVTVASLTTRIILTFSSIVRTPIRILERFTNKLLKLLGIKQKNNLASARSIQEISYLLRVSELSGSIDPQLSNLVSKSLAFNLRTADELMTPRAKVKTLSINDTPDDLINSSISTGYSRFPVINGDFDETIGFVDIKQVIALNENERIKTKLKDLANDLIKIPETLQGDAVMQNLQNSGVYMALVVDEYGGNAGIVTFEDLIEEIVGEVQDEYDSQNERVIKIGDGYTVQGLLRLDEIEEEIGLKAPVGEYETLAGLILAELGYIPKIGDNLIISERNLNSNESNNENDDSNERKWNLSISKMDGHRIDEVLVSPVNFRVKDRV